MNSNEIEVFGCVFLLLNSLIWTIWGRGQLYSCVVNLNVCEFKIIFFSKLPEVLALSHFIAGGSFLGKTPVNRFSQQEDPEGEN